MVLLAGLVTALISPRSGEACSLGGPSARIHWPSSGTNFPVDGYIWVTQSGVGERWAPSFFQLETTNGEPVHTEVSVPEIVLEERYTQSGYVRLHLVTGALTPSSSYVLVYDSAPGERARFELETVESTAGAPSASFNPELMFVQTGEPPEMISSCSSRRANEVAIVFLQPPPESAWLLATARYADGTQTEPRFQTVVEMMTFTFWASDKGIPCVQFHAVSANGVKSPPLEVCRATACDGIDGFNRSYAAWRAYGPDSCEPTIPTTDSPPDSSEPTVPTTDSPPSLPPPLITEDSGEGGGCGCVATRSEGLGSAFDVLLVLGLIRGARLLARR